jgi:Holliday junction resolvasome RuvABC endonuclease subunit
MGFDLAIDPGTKCTGAAVFVGGRYVTSNHFRGYGKTTQARRHSVIQRLLLGVSQWTKKFGNVERCAIEDYSGFSKGRVSKTTGRGLRNNVAPPADLKVLNETRGAIQYELGRSLGIEIQDVLKGKAPKQQAQMLARKLGLFEINEDEADAIYVGLLAGYLK